MLPNFDFLSHWVAFSSCSCTISRLAHIFIYNLGIFIIGSKIRPLDDLTLEVFVTKTHKIVSVSKCRLKKTILIIVVTV